MKQGIFVELKQEALSRHPSVWSLGLIRGAFARVFGRKNEHSVYYYGDTTRASQTYVTTEYRGKEYTAWFGSL